MKKHLLLLVLALMTLVGNTWGGQWIDDLYYELHELDHTASIVKPSTWQGHITTNLVIPSTVSYGGQTYSVTRIETDAFRNNDGLYSVVIPSSIVYIGECAFGGCHNLVSLYVDASHISNHSFWNCVELSEVTIGPNVQSIEQTAFRYCVKLTTFHFNARNMTGVDPAFFQQWTSSSELISTVTIGDGVETIPDYLFYQCTDITSIKFPSSVVTIGEGAFTRCHGLTELTIGPNVTSIGQKAFEACVDIKTLYYNARHCDIAGSLFLPREKYKPSEIFEGIQYSKLNTLYIGSEVTEISNIAFIDCHQINCIYVLAETPPTVYGQTFNYSTNTALFVPSNSYNAYRTHPYWGQFRVIPMDVIFCNRQVIEDNNAPIISNAITSGTVYYDKQSKSLHLENAYIDCPNQLPIISAKEDFEIYLEGDNTINTKCDYGIVSLANSTITGPGTLTIVSDKGILAYCSDLSVKAQLTLTGSSQFGESGAIIGTEGHELLISYCDVDIYNSEHQRCPIEGFSDVTLQGCHVAIPAGAVYSTADREFQDENGDIVSDHLKIVGDEYDLKVAGVTVTAVNASDILGDGTASYDANSHTLTLDNAIISYIGSYGIQNGISNLNLRLVGDNFINVSTDEQPDYSSQSAISTSVAMSISGDSEGGALHAAGANAIAVGSGNLTISNCDLKVYGSFTGFYSNPNNGNTLSINNALVTVSSNNYPIIFNHLSLSGVCLNTQDGTIFWDESQHIIANTSNETPYHGTVDFGEESYPLTINRCAVSSSNASDIFGDGTAIYDAETNTLTLNNVSIDYAGVGSVISYLGIRDFTLNVIGTNNLNAVHSGNLTPTAVVYCETNLIITGGGTLNANAETGCCIYGNTSKTLTVNNSVINASLAATDAGYPIYFGNLQLLDGTIIRTSGITWSSTQHCFITNSTQQIYRGHVTIGVLEYPIIVCGVQITSANASDVFGDGTVSFDIPNGTLILNNFMGEAATGISNSYGGLHIRLIGDNVITATEAEGILSSGSIIIEGSGTLMLIGADGIDINKDLTIQGGCSVDVICPLNGNYAPIKGIESKTLTINNSSVRAVGASDNWTSICGFGSLNLSNCEIIEPSNVVYNETSHRMELNGQPYYGEVAIGQAYVLWVAGVTVTSMNADNITGTNISGTVRYDVATNTLLLRDANVNTNLVGVYTEIPDMKLRLEGENTLVSSTYSGLEFTDNLTIEGPGSLNVTGISGIFAFGCSLTINDCTVNAVGTGSGQYEGGIKGDDYPLNINNAIVRAIAEDSDWGSICGFSELNLNGCAICTPVGASWDEDYACVTDSESEPASGEVIISPAYELAVGGIIVGVANASHVEGEQIVGSVCYNPDNNSLILTNAQITAAYGYPGIDSSIPDLKIVLVGENTIYSEFGSGVYAAENLTIMGSGMLTINSEEDGIYVKKDLAIQDGCIVNTLGNGHGNYSGIYGLTGYYLTVENATVIAEAPNSSVGSIYGFSGLRLRESSICQPHGAAWNNTSHTVTLDAAMVTNQVVISIPYQIRVNDIMVTAYNADDVLGDGTVSYNATTRTLTLNSANIVTEGDIYGIIANNTNNLVIELVGTNSIVSNFIGMRFYGNTLIKGSGTLNVTGTTAIDAMGNLTVEDCTLNAIGDCEDAYEHCYAFYGSNDKTLTINGAFVTASVLTNTYQSCPIVFGDVALIQSEVLSPEGAEWNGTNHRFEMNGVVVTDEIFIGTTYYLTVAGVSVNSMNAQDILGDGTAQYDVETQTLTLRNFDVTCVDGISGSIEGLTIVCEGSNHIVAEGTGIYNLGNLTIDCSNQLDVTGLNGIVLSGGNLEIIGGGHVSVEAGNGLGISGENNFDLSVNASIVTASVEDTHEGTQSAITGFTNLILNRCVLLEPDEAIWDTDEHNVMVHGVVTPDPVAIIPVYDIEVAGVRITGLNADDVLGDGSVSYDARNNVLTLNDATINCPNTVSDPDGIHYYGEEKLTIRPFGYSKINGLDDGINLGDMSAIVCISGSGRLEINAPYGIYDDSYTHLIIENGCVVEVNSQRKGVQVGKLTVNGSSLLATGTLLGSIYSDEEPTLVNCSITIPAGAAWENGHIWKNGDIVKTKVCISADEYPIMIKDIIVNAGNAHDVLDDGGSVVYDHSTQTLTLTNATIQGDDSHGIVKQSGELKIVLVGDNVIDMGTYGHGIINDSGDLTIGGAGSLTISGVLGIETYANLILEDGCVVTVYNAIYSNRSNNLTVDHSTLIAVGDDTELTIEGFGDVILTGTSEVIEPPTSLEWECYDETYGCTFYAFDNSEKPCRADIIISPTYDLWLNETHVSDYTLHDILYDYMIPGLASFDPATNTLTLEDINVEYGINSQLPDLTIVLKGDNIVSEGVSAKNLTIEGPGTLDLTDACPALLINGSYLVIRDACVVHAESSGSSNSCSAVFSINNATLTVQNAVLIAEHLNTSDVCPINGFSDLVMQPSYYCYITEPEYGYWFEDAHAIYNSSNTMETGRVVISTNYEIKVAGVAVTPSNASDVLGDGTVSYDYINDVLTLNEANIETAVHGIQASHINLKVALSGHNTIDATNYGIWALNGLTLSGPGSLDVCGEVGILSNKDFDVEDCILNVIGRKSNNSSFSPIYGASNYSFTIHNAKVKVSLGNTNSTSGVVTGFGSLSLDGVSMIYPENGTYDETNHYVVDAYGDLFNGQVLIQPVKIFTGNSVSNHRWDCATNWTPNGMPTAMDRAIVVGDYCVVYDYVVVGDLVISSESNVEVTTGAVLEAESITCSNWDNLFIDYGAQVVSYGGVFTALLERNIISMEQDAGWNLASFPLVDYTYNAALSSREMYRYNETSRDGQEWENYKANSFATQLGRGYIFASSNATEALFTGTVNVADANYTVTYTESESYYPLAGYNLIGNPFTHNIYKGEGAAIDNSHLAAGYYTLTNYGTWIPKTDAVPIAPMQAILVRTDATTTLNITNTTEAPLANSKGQSAKVLSLSGNGFIDQVILVDGEGSGLTKIAHMNAEAPMLYVSQDGGDYASACMKPGSKLTLCVKVAQAGTYTLSTDAQPLTLIDTLTGEQVELGAEGYTFEATPEDSVERFIIEVK